MLEPIVQFSYNGVEFVLVKHDALRIKTQQAEIYIDPFRLPSEDLKSKADIIFITHDHFDHFSPEDIKKIYKNGTICVFPASIQEKVEAGLSDIRDKLKFVPVKTGRHYKLDSYNLEFSAIPAYNVNKFRSPGVPYHPKESEYVGYIINLAGTLIYFAGDTDKIEEMKYLTGKIDVVFLPVSGKYVMTIDEAVEAVKVIAPKIVVPMHYGEIVGDLDYGEKFATKLEKQGVNIPVYFYKPQE